MFSVASGAWNNSLAAQLGARGSQAMDAHHDAISSVRCLVETCCTLRIALAVTTAGSTRADDIIDSAKVRTPVARVRTKALARKLCIHFAHRCEKDNRRPANHYIRIIVTMILPPQAEAPQQNSVMKSIMGYSLALGGHNPRGRRQEFTTIRHE